MSKLESKKVLITGSTSGIGLAIAKVFAKQNSTVILNGLGTIDEINTIIGDLSSQTSGRVLHYGANLIDPLAIEEMMKKIKQEVGEIDVLINNAGVQHVEPIETFPVKKWDEILALNLSAYFHTIRHTISFMKENRWGRIINIASTHGLVASPYKSAYVAAKHGVVGLTKVVALETGGQGVTCNAICPGWVLQPTPHKIIILLSI